MLSVMMVEQGSVSNCLDIEMTPPFGPREVTASPSVGNSSGTRIIPFEIFGLFGLCAKNFEKKKKKHGTARGVLIERCS
jgi:hypothetical protein